MENGGFLWTALTSALKIGARKTQAPKTFTVLAQVSPETVPLYPLSN